MRASAGNFLKDHLSRYTLCINRMYHQIINQLRLPDTLAMAGPLSALVHLLCRNDVHCRIRGLSVGFIPT